MAKTIQAKEVNEALTELDKEIKTVEGVFNLKTVYDYIKKQNQIINDQNNR